MEAIVLACITCCLDVVFVGEQAVNMPTVLHALGEIPKKLKDRFSGKMIAREIINYLKQIS